MDRRAGILLLSMVLAVTVLVPAVVGEQVTRADRESSYPAAVANVTQSPWTPRAGEDVAVTLRLKDDAPIPDAVSLLFCRVEPEYVCGIPFRMDPDPANTTWTGVLVWDDRFMRDETVHVGYNLTLRYLERETGRVERVAAPTGNHWVPATFPADSDGVYFFYRYTREDAGESPDLALLPLVGLLGALMWLVRRSPRGGIHGER